MTSFYLFIANSLSQQAVKSQKIHVFFLQNVNTLHLRKWQDLVNNSQHISFVFELYVTLFLPATEIRNFKAALVDFFLPLGGSTTS